MSSLTNFKSKNAQVTESRGAVLIHRAPTARIDISGKIKFQWGLIDLCSHCEILTTSVSTNWIAKSNNTNLNCPELRLN